MLPTIIVDLPTLAREVNDAHAQTNHHAKGMLLEAKRAGDALLTAKGLCQHGTFKEWVQVHCKCGYRQASAYMRVAKLSKDADLHTFDGGIDAFLQAFATKRSKEPLPEFTHRDAEHVLRIRALAERGVEHERDVAANKLTKVTEAFGVTAEAVVKREIELCPGNGLTDHEKEVRGNEERLKEEASASQKKAFMYRELEKRFFSTSKEDILHILIDLRIKGIW
ncbi:hypothetical protein GAY29_31670 [Azospirillum brasilense]|uniref:hypothetical protein n=1 Tax=Azospirillum brasilense TaxID=192 RepID=UPI001909821F|nr:hypothetical protein [Azospirillum brasilense]MBK3737517.1 hypothetical protein [Azospirillum brasilense]